MIGAYMRPLWQANWPIAALETDKTDEIQIFGFKISQDKKYTKASKNRCFFYPRTQIKQMRISGEMVADKTDVCPKRQKMAFPNLFGLMAAKKQIFNRYGRISDVSLFFADLSLSAKECNIRIHMHTCPCPCQALAH